MTETLGLIGAGRIGQALGGLALHAGMDVVVSNSRGPGSLAGLVARWAHGGARPPPEVLPDRPISWWSRCRWAAWPSCPSPNSQARSSSTP